jgi:hypothetical protein
MPTSPGDPPPVSVQRPVDGRPGFAAARVPTELRERVIERLSLAFAEEGMETAEFENRVTIAHRSGSVAEVEALLQDLAPATALVPRAAEPSLVPAAAAPPRTRTVSVLGSTLRAGQWRVPSRLEVRAVLGNVELDFRQAVIPAGVVELDLRAVLGNIEITVPPSLAVEAEGMAVLGNFDHVDRAPADPASDAPVLRVKGTSVLGNVSIVMKLPRDKALAARKKT